MELNIATPQEIAHEMGSRGLTGVLVFEQDGRWKSVAFPLAMAPEKLMIATTKALDHLASRPGISYLSAFDQARARDEEKP